MTLRSYARWRTLVVPLTVLALFAAACGEPGGDGDPDATDDGDQAAQDGGTITVASFNFPESVVLGEIYAQALEDAGFDVETRLDLGTRELLLPELEGGDIDLLPEYLGSALSAGFGGEPTADAEETRELLQAEYDAIGVTVLEPAPGENTNAFVVADEFAQENGLETLADLAEVEETITFAGPPECEERETCYLGLVETYGLEDIEFEVIQEGAVRVDSLAAGQIDMALLFSTQPVIEERDFVVLEDTEGVVPAENVAKVVRDEVLEQHGDELTELLNAISELITTEELLEMNRRIEVETDRPGDVARDWLEENGLIGNDA
jgi:osmoprotectant transport system substrate-binding protein